MAGSPAARPRVLVVEDDPAVSKLLEAVLGAGGRDVVATPDAAEGVRLVTQGVFTLAILDHHVVNGTGMDVAKALRARSADTPILFISGTWTADQQAQAAAVPNSRIFPKPLDIGRLEAALREMNV
jgi:DNA-binding response OmpR family regulator